MTIDLSLLDFLDHYISHVGFAAVGAAALLSGVGGYLLGRLRVIRAKQKYVDEVLPVEEPVNFVVGHRGFTREPIEEQFYRAEYVKKLKAELAALRWRHKKVIEGHEAKCAAVRELMKTAGRKREE